MPKRVVKKSSGFVPTAEFVGNAFAMHYYSILQQPPALVHRFYTDVSKVGRIEHGGAMTSITGKEAINEKIQALGSLKADIKSVDVQGSYNGGVIVLVTGSMVVVDDLRRSFTQTFFLAPQDKGYFVFNDILRYEDDDANVKQETGISLAVPSQAITAARVLQESSSFVPTALMVGNLFAKTYYTALQESPRLVHLFYKDTSELGRVERGGGLSSTTTMAAIDEKIRALGSLKADIKSVDAQDSYNGGVIILVTGSMVGEKDDSRRAFIQTFFLAPQHKGYFVLNDILRYLEDVHVKQENEDTRPVLENQNSEQTNEEVYNTGGIQTRYNNAFVNILPRHLFLWSKSEFVRRGGGGRGYPNRGRQRVREGRPSG